MRRIEDRNVYIIQWLDKCWAASHLPSCAPTILEACVVLLVSLFENPGSATLLPLAAHSSPPASEEPDYQNHFSVK